MACPHAEGDQQDPVTGPPSVHLPANVRPAGPAQYRAARSSFSIGWFPGQACRPAMWRSGADFQSMRPSAADDAADLGRGNHSGQFGLTPHLEGATLTIELAAQEAGMGEIGAGRADEPESPWTGPVIALLRDWGRRAERSHSINLYRARKLRLADRTRAPYYPPVLLYVL